MKIKISSAAKFINQETLVIYNFIINFYKFCGFFKLDMNKFFQISCLIVMSLLLVSSKRFQLLGKTKLNCRKDSSNQVSKENYIDCLSKLLRDESVFFVFFDLFQFLIFQRKEDKDMMDEIARAFVENKRTDKVNF